MSFLDRIFGNSQKERQRLRPLYLALVDRARDPAWYAEGEVPDTVDGRFDVLASLLSLTLLRLERDGELTKRMMVLLTEIFIEDMEGNLRQIGIGDLVVGKHVGRTVSALGGRLEAYRNAEGLASVVRRNIFRDSPPSDAAVERVAVRLDRFRVQLSASSLESLLAGELPRP